MHLNPRISCFLGLTIGLAAALLAQDPRGPGYSGTFPSAAGQEALRTIATEGFEDKEGRLGGGKWQAHAGAVTPHALGPARGDVMELRSVVTKGPHLRLVQGHLAICLPTATDGDVAATLRWLGKPVPAGIVGEPTAAWRQAVARVEALGAPVAGHRAAVTAIADKPGSVDLLLWKVDTREGSVAGRAHLLVDGQQLPVAVVWPSKAKAAGGESVLSLKPGSTYDQILDVNALLVANGKPALVDGDHDIEFVLAMDGMDPVELRSQRRKLTVGAKARVDGSAGGDAKGKK